LVWRKVILTINLSCQNKNNNSPSADLDKLASDMNFGIISDLGVKLTNFIGLMSDKEEKFILF